MHDIIEYVLLREYRSRQHHLEVERAELETTLKLADNIKASIENNETAVRELVAYAAADGVDLTASERESAQP